MERDHLLFSIRLTPCHNSATNLHKKNKKSAFISKQYFIQWQEAHLHRLQLLLFPCKKQSSTHKKNLMKQQ